MDAIKRLISVMETDAALIISEPNRFYFTGMVSSAGTIFVTKEQTYFIIDFRYIEQARNTVKGCQVLLQEDLHGQLNSLIEKHHVKTVGVESSRMSLAVFADFQEKLNAALLTDNRLNDAIEALREVKTPYEIQCFRTAQNLTDDSFVHIQNYIKPGVSEQDLILELGNYMERHGSENRSFDYIAVSGKNTSLPHGRATTKKVEDGDFVMLDIGFVIGGYHADMTRTVAVGHVTDEQRKVYDTVLEAQRRALEKIHAGAICSQVDAAARNYIDEMGYPGCFGHGLGHSVGIEIHENPRFNQVCKRPLKAGCVITVEPGIYLAGKFGVRIEDMVLVTEDGYENFTKSDKSLLIL